jgi:galactokinase
MDEANLAARFAALFGGRPRIFRAPGRVNLIGEHVDYNDGLVLPIAIDRFCYIAAAPRPDALLRVHSTEFDETVAISLDQVGGGQGHWSDYVAGVAWSLGRAGLEIAGADLLVDSEVPVGSGLSSSAALEVATATALLAISDKQLDPTDVALVGQRAESKYVGTECGIMDQLTACLGRDGHALQIDCRNLDVEYVPLDEARVRVVVADTMLKHDLATGEYNRRRAECQEALALAQVARPHARSLRDFSCAELASVSRDWPDHLRRRARHVTSEIERVSSAAQALRGGDFEILGRLLYESHASLDRDFEVSSNELNSLVELARDLPGVYGARMTGGGFGGCTVNLVRAESAESVASSLPSLYESATGIQGKARICRAADAAAEVAGPR